VCDALSGNRISTRVDCHHIAKVCARADHKLLIVPHRTLDTGGNCPRQLLTTFHSCTLLPQLRHGGAIGALPARAMDESNPGAAFRD